MGLIEGWTNSLCEKFNTAPPQKRACPPEDYCNWHEQGQSCQLNTKTQDPKIKLKNGEIWSEYKIRLNKSKAEEEEASVREEESDRERERVAAEEEDLEELYLNMNRPQVRPPRPQENIYPSKPSGQIPSIQIPRKQGRQISQPQVLQVIPQVFPPYQTNIYNNNVFMKNKYLSVRSDQYDFDPNSNVPRATGAVKSIGSERPSSKRRNKPHIQRSQDKILDKPARPEKTTKNNKKVKVPPTFAKLINQLLPILFIALIIIYIIYFYRKRGRGR